MKVISLFSGCGGLDLGFEKAGFEIGFANDNDANVQTTYNCNHDTPITIAPIQKITTSMLPACDGIIGGPPCQSWSCAGEMRGIKDARGQLFNEYIRVLKEVKPQFFMAENVAGILSRTHADAFNDIIASFEKLGYIVSYKLLNAIDYGVPQDRKRVIIVGMTTKKFVFPQTIRQSFVLKDAIGNIPPTTPDNGRWMGTYSPIYMARNRKRTWEQPSYTIMASGRQTPLHPDSCGMHKVGVDKWEFDDLTKVFRLSSRECARIQTFPDSFHFHSAHLDNVYKMIGNAVPVNFAEQIALAIKEQL